MALPRYMEKNNHVPQELVEEIMVNLPARSLLRFKLVCKSWNSLISDPSFINKHLQSKIHKTSAAFWSNSKTNTEVSLFLGWSNPDELIPYVSPVTIDIDKYYKEEVVDNAYDYESRLSMKDLLMNRYMANVGEIIRKSTHGLHCDGILCLVDTSSKFGENVGFHNLALRASKFITTGLSHLVESNYSTTAFGFGYDSKTKNYKFVRILTPEHRSPSSEYVSRAEVYTFGTQSWKVFSVKMRVDASSNNNGGGAYIKGFYFWFVRDFHGCEWILSFDMSKEKFRSFTVPVVHQDRPRLLGHCTACDDLLVIFYSPGRYDRFSCSTIEMWVMENNYDGRDEVKWGKWLTIRPLMCIIKPITFWKYDELLMETEDGRIMSYNVRTEKFKRLPIRGPVTIPDFITFVSFYVDSLVSPS